MSLPKPIMRIYLGKAETYFPVGTCYIDLLNDHHKCTISVQPYRYDENEQTPIKEALENMTAFRDSLLEALKDVNAFLESMRSFQYQELEKERIRVEAAQELLSEQSRIQAHLEADLDDQRDADPYLGMSPC